MYVVKLELYYSLCTAIADSTAKAIICILRTVVSTSRDSSSSSSRMMASSIISRTCSLPTASSVTTLGLKLSNLFRYQLYKCSRGSHVVINNSRFFASHVVSQPSSHPPSITLYQYAICPFCCKTKALLDYLSLKYEQVEVNPLTKKELNQL